MPPAKGKKGKTGNSKKTKSRAPDPTSDCIFPKEIISNILSRLPVKDLLKFRCVSKPWRKLISNPQFIATHFQHSSSSSSSILICTSDANSSDHVLSLYKTDIVEKLDNPYPCFFPSMSVVGPCNGIMCLLQHPYGDVITLWNPSMRQSRMVRLSDNEPGIPYLMVSVGLAFDYQENDLLILRMFCQVGAIVSPFQLEMCSTKSNYTWMKLNNEVAFTTCSYTCDAIVKGVPYWRCAIEDELFLARPVLMRFDVGRKVFDMVTLPDQRNGVERLLVNLEDSLGMLMWEKERKDHIDVWVMDDEYCWSRKCKVGPLFGVDRIAGCLRNADILVENENGEILLFDRVTSLVKARFSVDNAKSGSYLLFDYSESLNAFSGMLPVKKQDATSELARKKLTRACKSFMQSESPASKLGYIATLNATLAKMKMDEKF